MDDDKYPFLKRLKADDFPAGAFTICCAILGAICNYWTGLWLFNWFALSESNTIILFLVWMLLGIGCGVGVALKFICWLADRS